MRICAQRDGAARCRCRCRCRCRRRCRCRCRRRCRCRCCGRRRCRCPLQSHTKPLSKTSGHRRDHPVVGREQTAVEAPNPRRRRRQLPRTPAFRTLNTTKFVSTKTCNPTTLSSSISRHARTSPRSRFGRTHSATALRNGSFSVAAVSLRTIRPTRRHSPPQLWRARARRRVPGRAAHLQEISVRADGDGAPMRAACFERFDDLQQAEGGRRAERELVIANGRDHSALDFEAPKEVGSNGVELCRVQSAGKPYSAISTARPASSFKRTCVHPPSVAAPKQTRSSAVEPHPSYATASGARPLAATTSSTRMSRV